MVEINQELLLWFARKALAINEGGTIDARLGSSVSKAVSRRDELKR